MTDMHELPDERASCNSLTIPDLRDGYVDLVEWVRREGREVAPRGMRTREIEDAVIIVENPLDVIPIGVGRDPRPEIGAAEALLLIGGLSDPTLMTNVSGAFKRFLDGGVLHGAYGPRVRPQLAIAADRLENDPDTRQAIVSVWDPLYDSQETRDLPCTLNMGFRIRDGRLNMSVTMRSNDVYLGVAYDFFMFTQLQATMANVLGLPLGTYRHHAYSLHLYERNLKSVELLHYTTGHRDSAGRVMRAHEHPSGLGPAIMEGLSAGERMRAVMARAQSIHRNIMPALASDSERWYIDVLAPYERLLARENFTA